MFDATPPGRPRAPASDLDAWAQTALRQIRAGAIAPGPSWTRDSVGQALVDALRWLRHAESTPGPRGFAHARLLELHLSLEDHAAMGWGLPEIADPDDAPRPAPPRLSPAQVSRHLETLSWGARYLRDADGSRAMVALWAGCRAGRVSFKAALKARGTIDRGLAYRLRDRGLSLIAMGLTADRVPVDPPR